MSHDLDEAGAHDHDHEDEVVDPARAAEVQDEMWKTDNVELTTVGVDIGSATSHLMFSRLHLRRRADAYSSRFAVVSRRVLHKSAIRLTPYREDGLIDAEALHAFIDDAYREARYQRSDIDAGAVILTGVALERPNARVIAELFADEGGRFVCATAGHNLEALLAAHGSGAVARSRDAGPILNVDVGGGTTKLAMCIAGRVEGTMAISGGARLVAWDETGAVVRIEQEFERLATDQGIAVAVGTTLSTSDRRWLAAALADRIGAAVEGRPVAGTVLAGELPPVRPSSIVISGGVAEYIGAPDGTAFGDLGRDLAAAVLERLGGTGIPVDVAAERIRATVIGASQFSVQLSGNTVHISDGITLPMHGIPVVAIEFSDEPFPSADAIRAAIDHRTGQLDLRDREEPIALAIGWNGEPRYDRLRALADGLAAAHCGAPRRGTPIVLALLADVAASLGAILEHELDIDNGVVAIDGLDLADLDFIDIGARIMPANVVPVVVKSLVFPDPGAVNPPRVLGAA